LVLRGLPVLLSLVLIVACGGGSEDTAGSATATSTPKPTASRTPTHAPTPTGTPAPEVVTVAPVPAQDTEAPQVTPAPTQPPAPPATNQAPAFPDSISISTDTSFEYDDDGYLTGAVTVITVPAAADPDGDSLTYNWSASNGSISGAGVTATWTRALDFGEPQPGTVTVTADDGRGGSDVLEIEVQ
jgi:hypothetical protein